MDLDAARALLAEHAFVPGRSSTRDLKPAVALAIKAACALLDAASRPQRLPRMCRVSEGRPVVEGPRVVRPGPPAPPAPAPVVGRPRMPEDVPGRGDRPALIAPGVPRPARPPRED